MLGVTTVGFLDFGQSLYHSEKKNLGSLFSPLNLGCPGAERLLPPSPLFCVCYLAVVAAPLRIAALKK